jgi:hypothetical protein
VPRGVAGDVPIEPTLPPLLERLVKGRSPTERLLPLMWKWSEKARGQDAQAPSGGGPLAPEAHENTATTMHVGSRSWRDTGIKWLTLAGVEAPKM